MDTIQENVNKLPASLFTQSLQALAKNAGDDVNRFRTAVGRWYDDHHGPRVRLVQAARRRDHAPGRSDPGGTAQHQHSHHRPHPVQRQHREHGRERGGREGHRLRSRPDPGAVPGEA